MRSLPPQRRQRAVGGTAVEEQHRRGAWVRYWPLLAVVVGGLVLGCVLIFPRLLYPPLTATELQARGITKATEQLPLQEGRLKLQNDARTTMLQALGGLLVVSTAGAGAYTAWRQLQENRRQQQRNEELSREELRLTRESHIAERFTRAVEQLGNNDALDVRLGGIYTLERFAQDSPERDHPTVVEVLGAFVREHSRRHDPPPPKQGMAEEAAEKPSATAPGTDVKPRPATDVQAALTVLGRLPQQPNVSRGDLTGAQIAGAQLVEADLSGAQLVEANLSDANLVQVDLSGARLDTANLSGAQLYGADLSGAQLERANLSAADLSRAQELTQGQLDVARGDAKTQLRDGLRRPTSRTAAPPASPGSSPMTG